MTSRLWASRADQTAPPRYTIKRLKRVINLSLSKNKGTGLKVLYELLEIQENFVSELL